MADHATKDDLAPEQDWLGDTSTLKDNSPRSSLAEPEPESSHALEPAKEDVETADLAFLDEIELTKVMDCKRWQKLYDDAAKQGAEQTNKNAAGQAGSGSALSSIRPCSSEEALKQFLADSEGWQEYMARVDGATDALASIDPALLQSTANNDTGSSAKPDQPPRNEGEPTEPSEKSKGKQPMRYDPDVEATLAVSPDLLEHFANLPGMNYIPCQNCYCVAQLGYHTFPNLIDMLIPPHFFLAYSGARDDHIAMLKPLLSLFKSCIAQSAATYVKAQRAADHDTMQRISGELVNQVRPALTGLRVALEQYFECCFKDTPELRNVVMTALTDPEIGPNDWISAHHP